jgi:hypothetical protein
MLFNKLKDTRLKSLKYGDDRPGGGNSSEPILSTPILDANTVGIIPTFKSAAEENKKRISALLKSTPRGLKFVSNQSGLQLSNTRLEISSGPLLNQFGVGGGFGTEIARILNRSINAVNTATGVYNRTANRLLRTTPLLPYNPDNTITQAGALQGEHLDRFGLTPYINDNLKYINIVRANNSGAESINNRLVLLQTKLGVGNGQGSLIGRTQQKLKALLGGTTSLLNTATSVANIFGGNTLINRINNKINQISQIAAPYLDPVIDQYIGGPGSVNGIGITNIRRYDFTNTRGQDTGRNSTRLFKGRAGGLLNKSVGTYLGASLKYPKVGNKKPESSVAINFNKLQAQINKEHVSFFSASLNTSTVQYEYLTESTNYVNGKRIEIKLDRTSDTFDYVDKDSHRISFYDRDDVKNMTIAFELIDPFSTTASQLQRVAFPAYINNFKVNSDATWNDISYIGRSEYLHVFHKFKRQVSFGFQIPCFNIVQLRERHRALGNLESSLAGVYNNNKLGGIITKLYVANYLKGETGIINSLSWDIPNESSWDLEEKLAHNINVSVNFTVIGNALPQHNSGSGFFDAIPDGAIDTFIGGTIGPTKTPTQVYTAKIARRKLIRDFPTSIQNTIDATVQNEIASGLSFNLPEEISTTPVGFVTDEEYNARKAIADSQEATVNYFETNFNLPI